MGGGDVGLVGVVVGRVRFRSVGEATITPRLDSEFRPKGMEAKRGSPGAEKAARDDDDDIRCNDSETRHSGMQQSTAIVMRL